MEQHIEDGNIAAVDVFKPSWYVEQMKGWSFKSYMLLMLGIGVIVGTTITQPINATAIVTMIAAILGFTCTISITNAKPLNGVLGLVSALIYCYVAYQARNYNDILLQCTYMILLDIPVLVMPKWAKNVESHIKSLTVKHDSAKTAKHWALVALFFVVVLGLLFVWESRFTNSPRPLVDSIAATIGITGALLTTLRYSDTYFFWFTQGIMSIILWGITAAQGDANSVLFFTYMLYLANDLLAFFDRDIAWFHRNK